MLDLRLSSFGINTGPGFDLLPLHKLSFKRKKERKKTFFIKLEKKEKLAVINGLYLFSSTCECGNKRQKTNRELIIN